MAAMNVRHHLHKPCPITGNPIPGDFIFSDHSRPGLENACHACHDDRRSFSEMLYDLNRSREQNSQADQP
jgi:hypothetical protein